MKARVFSILIWVGVATVFALAASLIIVRTTPNLIMGRALSAYSELASGGAIHLPPPDHSARRVVRPSPDLAYSICVYDIAAAPFMIRAYVPDIEYWSVAAYASNTDNFWVLNNVEVAVSVVDIVIGTGDQLRGGAFSEGVHKVQTSSRKGLVLFRYLVAEKDDLAAIDAVRKDNQCESVVS